MAQTASIVVDEWRGCYGDGWKGTISDSAFAHPAKFAKGLIFTIMQHAIAEGFVKAGDTVGDPFGGVGLGGLPCALQGISWVGVELESRFCALANGTDCAPHFSPVVGGECAWEVVKHEACPTQEEHRPHHIPGNLELWQRRHGRLPQWVQPRMIQGDSRELGKVLGQTDCSVSSPPYAQGLGKEHTYADHAKREKDSHKGLMREKGIADPFYGDNPAQLGNMKTGELDCTIASPPYANGCTHTGGADPAPEHIQGGEMWYVAYGTESAQLGNLPVGSIEACVSSPPFMASTQVNTNPQDMTAGKALWKGGTDSASRIKQDYATYSEENLEKVEPDTFWSAARTILKQVYALLKPGGHAIWVVKSYVRDGKLVDFPGDWRRCAESVGFVTLHEHHALLVESHSERGLFGEEVEMYRRERKSFFRRLAEKGGSPRIDYEVVLCMVKPVGEGEGMIEMACSSPPYVDSWHKADTTDISEARMRKAGYSEDYIRHQFRASQAAGGNMNAQAYGASNGQLGAMSPGNITTVIASPPFVGKGEVLGQHNGIDFTKTQGTGQRLTPGRRMQPYGTTSGQLGAMPPGEHLGG